MHFMRSFTSTYRLQGLSVPEIAGEFEEATLRVGRRFQFNGKKLKPGPLLNAIVLWYLRLPEDERVRFSGEWIARLEESLAETDEERAAAILKIPTKKAPGRASRPGAL